MKDYLRDRVVADAAHAIGLAAQQAPLQHQGVKGRLRELIAQRLLRPWLPPYVGCGTGTIIHGQTEVIRRSTQDDLIIYDRTLTPPILIEESASEGIFLNNSVLARIEVKSTVCVHDVREFARSTKGFNEIGFVRPPNVLEQQAREALLCRSILLAFDSDTKGPRKSDSEIARFTRTLSQEGTPPESASVLCVVGRGLWMLRSYQDTIRWHRLKLDDPAQQLACFVATMSSTIFHVHLQRTGIDSEKALPAGIGMYFPSADEWELDSAAS